MNQCAVLLMAILNKLFLYHVFLRGCKKKAATGFYFFCDSHIKKAFICATFEANIYRQGRQVN